VEVMDIRTELSIKSNPLKEPGAVTE